MPDTDVLNKLLACPRCDKSPLEQKDDNHHCSACKIDFPSIDGIPWMFAEPEASLGEWRGRMQLALQTLSHESALGQRPKVFVLEFIVESGRILAQCLQR